MSSQYTASGPMSEEEKIFVFRALPFFLVALALLLLLMPWLIDAGFYGIGLYAGYKGVVELHRRSKQPIESDAPKEESL